MSQKPLPASPQISEDKEKMTTPILKSFLIPLKSPHLPTGSKKIAVESKKEVTTQLNSIALSLKLFSMAGKAIFMEEIKNVPINEVIATMLNIDICFFVQFIKFF